MGLLVDFTGVHFFLGGAIGVWSLGFLMHVNADTLYAGRAVLGAGQAGVFAGIGRLTRSWFPARIRSSVQGAMGVACARGGGLSSYLLVGTLMLGFLALPWQTAIWLLASSGMVYAVIFLTMFRNSPRQHRGCNEAEVRLIEGDETVIDAPRRSSMRQMLRRTGPRSYINLGFLCFSACFSTIADAIYSSWIPMFLDNAYGLTYKEMGFQSALPLAGGVMGGILGGILNDRMIRWTGNRRWARSLVGFFGKGMAAILLAVALLYYENPYLFCSMLLGVKLFADMSLATRWGAATDMGGRMVATLFAVVNFVAIGADIIGEKIYGWVLPVAKADRASPEAWLPVFYIGIGMYVLCALMWLFVDCTIPLISEEDDQDGEDGELEIPSVNEEDDE